MNKIINILLLLTVSLCLLASCDDEKVFVVKPTKKITIIFTPGGLGDRSYNDMILRGIQMVNKKADNVDIDIHNPGCNEEAETLLQEWLDEPESKEPSLLVLASAQYEEMAARLLEEYKLDDKNKQILIFETDNKNNLPVSYFKMPMYGVSYISGYIAAQCSDKAMVLLGNGSDMIVREAADGFADGYAECGKTACVKALSNDVRGYSMAREAYEKMYEWGKEYDFVYAVAGGSNMGVFRYLREYPGVHASGADVDQSEYSNQIIGSSIKKIDEVICEYVMQWVENNRMPENNRYGLNGAYTDYILSNEYKDAFAPLSDEIRKKAIEKERLYYENK